MKFKEGNIPLYFQFYLMLKNDIMLGEIEPGSRIPNIEELHDRYGVSHATVRKAMALLEKEGLIIKKRGMGTIVRNEVDVTMWVAESSRKNLLSDLTTMKPKTISTDWIVPPRRIVKIFKNRPEAFKKGLIFNLYRFWTSPVEHWRKRVSNVYVPAYLVDEFGEEHLAKSYILANVVQKRKFKSLKIKTTLRPWICDTDTAELIGLTDGTPVFHRTIVIRSPQSEVILVSEWIATTTSFVRDISIRVEELG